MGQAEFDDSYRTWETTSAVIEGRLSAYFPDSNLAADWRRYSQAVSAFYALQGQPDRIKRTQATQELLQRLPIIEPQEVVSQYVEEDRRRYALAADVEVAFEDQVWSELKAQLLGRKDAIVRRVFKEHAASF